MDFCKEFSKVTAVAVDGFRLSVENSICLDIDEDFTVYIKPTMPRFKGDDMAIIEKVEDKCFISIGGNITGFKQPTGEFMDYKKVVAGVTESKPIYRIGFNGDILISALQAAKVSCGNTFRKPIVIEFRRGIDPVVIRTNTDDIKIALPVRLKTDK